MKMEDIARMAGVSKSAVSLALSGKSGISTKTREKILKVVKDTGYIPRSMVQADQFYRVSNSIRFLVVTDSTFMSKQYRNQPFFMELIQYIEEQCRLKGYSLLFSTIDISDLEEGRLLFQEENDDSGIILLGTNLSKEQIQLVKNSQPNLVVLDNYIDELDVDFVVMNNKMGAYQACAHLMEQRHQHIGYVQSGYSIFNFQTRKDGFYRAQKELGFSSTEADVFTIADKQGFVDQLKDLRDKQKMPTALFCENDYAAISVIKVLNENNIRVPEDISVIGFDNISESTIITPELTTIHVEKEMMAILAVEQIVRILTMDKSIGLKTVVDTSLKVRKSSKEV